MKATPQQQTVRPRHILLYRTRWRLPWTAIIASLVVIAGVSVFLYPHVASWFSQKEQSRAIAIAQQTIQVNEKKRPNPYVAQLEDARKYNEALASGVKLEANANVPKGHGTTKDESLNYQDMLAGSEGVMGRLRYSKLDIDLPIYHGTSDATLLRGIGHLEGTSLPVGGIGQRAVLTAHRGLPESTLFTHLDKAKKGDIFTVAVLDQVLSYRVIDNITIEPSETEVLFADPNKDLVTLITCTPLGINTHRILVTGERIVPTPQSEVDDANKVPELPRFPWWLIILIVTITGAGIYIWRSGYQTAKPRAIVKPTDAEAENEATDPSDTTERVEDQAETEDRTIPRRKRRSPKHRRTP